MSPILVEDDVTIVDAANAEQLNIELFDLTDNDDDIDLAILSASQQDRQLPSRNGPVELPYAAIDNFQLNNGECVRVGDCVEISIGEQAPKAENRHLQTGDFLRITSIVENLETEEVEFRGHRFRRSHYYRGLLHRTHANEVICELHVEEDDVRAPLEQAVDCIRATNILRKRDLVLTTKAHPADSWREGPDRIPYDSQSKDAREVLNYINNFAKLTARYVLLRKFCTSKQRKEGKPHGGSFLRADMLLQRDQQNSVGRTMNSDATANATSNATSSLGHHSARSNRRVKTRKLRFMDTFCGAGGASAGARAAGYSVMAGVEMDPIRLKSWTSNNPGADCYAEQVGDFIVEHAYQWRGRIDHLHLSPPCQTWSPAHTRPGKDDEKNQAALFTVGEMIRIVQPKIVTVEETAGLMVRHPDFFQALVAQFHSAGYDVTWAKPNLAIFGVPQKSRERLLFMAVPAGNILPLFPPPTHGAAGSELQPFVTVREALSQIPGDAEDMDKIPPRAAGAADWDAPLANCMTCSGPVENHPSGKRQFTVREVAMLQGFPVDWQFSGSRTEVLRQIGNAYPPAAAFAHFQACKEALEAQKSLLLKAESIAGLPVEARGESKAQPKSIKRRASSRMSLAQHSDTISISSDEEASNVTPRKRHRASPSVASESIFNMPIRTKNLATGQPHGSSSLSRKDALKSTDAQPAPIAARSFTTLARSNTAPQTLDAPSADTASTSRRPRLNGFASFPRTKPGSRAIQTSSTGCKSSGGRQDNPITLIDSDEDD